MRLLKLGPNGEFHLVEYANDEAPPYAILSHTWGPAKEELIFQDLISNVQYKDKSGYKKILGCAKQALFRGLHFLWVDTCCIDKSSSAELSEAINSMYKWYRQADICYAYLSDTEDKSRFCESRWFTRGWTLQELLAPADVLFFNASWSEIGFKTSLTSRISQRTGISEEALRDGSDFAAYSIAERMSWAADRQSTRIEDEAYCLIGIFNIHMPLLYGEGRKSFYRLQEQILRRSNDASVFAYVAFESTINDSDSLSTIEKKGQVHKSEHTESRNDGSLQVDENPRQGTAGLFASSPNCYRSLAMFLPHRLSVNQYYGEPIERNALTFELMGPLVKFEAPVCRVLLHDLRSSQHELPSEDEPDFELLRDTIIEHGLLLTDASIRKLQKCIWAVENNTLIMAFLDVCRHSGGAIGMILRESGKPGVYQRHHFPSLVEAQFPSIRCNYQSFQVETIYVEADSLRMTHSDPTLPKTLATHDSRDSINFRETNLPLSGYQNTYATVGGKDTIRFYDVQDPSLPFISFLAEEKNAATGQNLDSQLVCNIYPNTGMKDKHSIEKDTEIHSEAIATVTGATKSIRLNDEFNLIVRTHMRWQRQNSTVHIENPRKECLITLSIVVASTIG